MTEGRPNPESLDDDPWMALTFDELHRVAQQLLSGERRGHTLQPTALVNEAWLRLQGQERWNDRLHFVRTAARAMRRVLVDHARSKGRERRGGEWDRVDLDPALAGSEFEFDDVDLLALDEAMTELEALSERQARIVELRFFAGLEVDDVARVLDVSTATVGRDWRFARAWLAKALDEG